MVAGVNDLTELLRKDDTTVAVVGANDHPGKYGYTIYRDLKSKGYRVLPVNPNRETVDGDPCYRSLADLPVRPTLVNIVTPPNVTLNVIKECERLGIHHVWLQPGSESPEVLDYLSHGSLNYLAQACIMVQSRFRTTS